MISPYDMKIPAQDDKKIITSEKETHNYMLNEEHPVNIYTDTAQEQNICAFYDDDDYVITHDVFMGYPEAANPEFIIGDEGMTRQMLLILCIHCHHLIFVNKYFKIKINIYTVVHDFNKQSFLINKIL